MKPLHWHEVSPRDGLQNESKILLLDDKLALLQHLTAAQPSSIEVTSFVRGDRVPQLADAVELCQRLIQQDWFQKAREQGMRFTGLVANQRGLDRLLESGLDSITVLVSATESHSQANVGMSRQAAKRVVADLIRQAKNAGLQVRAYVSMAFVCPFEGEVAPEPVLELMAEFEAQDADVILPADTLGAAHPERVQSLFQSASGQIPIQRLGMHMHNTHGHALQNCQIGWELGVQHFDAAAAGTGGCPFAPGAAGNLDSSSLLEWAVGSNADLRVDRAALNLAADLLRQKLA
jgi:hydroxymethylglutaryl-CoA lyase